ncbi:hypothetical protein CRUP_023410 [Coryphaenoides rupestris]|nr:hypothetical protein CRUP_023410 [Coryphaenoides rupestris]
MGKKDHDSPGDIVLRNYAVTDMDVDAKDNMEGEEEEHHTHERDYWTNKREYFLSMMGLTVGLTNIWRFPYLAYKHGGGAFLVPYFFMLTFLGIPFYLLEISIGQFCSQGPVHVWSAVPLLQGVGIAGVIANTLMSTSYEAILSYAAYYLFSSFQSPLPWTFEVEGANCTGTAAARVAANVSSVSASNWTAGNDSCPKFNTALTKRFWDDVVLRRSSGLDETGVIVWPLILCLLMCCILLSIILSDGVKTAGKVVYFTANFPLVVLTILVVYGLTLEGSGDGISYYVGSKSNWTKLAEVEVWRDAASQIFYSLSIGLGAVSALASYSKFQNNVISDAFLITLINSATSVFAGFAVFAMLGHLAHITGEQIEELVKEEFGLAFIIYPAGVVDLPVPTLWAVLFFGMLLVCGIDSQFSTIEAIVTTLHDTFPVFFSNKSPLVSAITCAGLFVLGIPCVTQAGVFWVKLIDNFVVSWALLAIGLAEIVGVIYVYGGNRFIQDIEMMIGTKSWWFWLYWRLIVVLSLVVYTPPTYQGVEYPDWGLSLGWCIGERYSQERLCKDTAVDDEPSSCWICCIS